MARGTSYGAINSPRGTRYGVMDSLGGLFMVAISGPGGPI